MDRSAVGEFTARVRLAGFAADGFSWRLSAKRDRELFTFVVVITAAAAQPVVVIGALLVLGSLT